jgi:hypothetical protein
VPSLEAFHKLKAIAVAEREWMTKRTYGAPSSWIWFKQGNMEVKTTPWMSPHSKLAICVFSPSHPDIRRVFLNIFRVAVLPPEGSIYWHAEIVELRCRLVENARPDKLSENDVIIYTIPSGHGMLIRPSCSRSSTGSTMWMMLRTYAIVCRVKEKCGKSPFTYHLSVNIDRAPGW